MLFKKRNNSILISGYYGFNNFGDEAILKILIKSLKDNLNNAEITVLSKDPIKTSSEFNVESINRMNFIQITKCLLSSKILISGGGSLLQDITSPLTIYYYLFIILLAQLMKVKTIVYAQGIGPIKRKTSLQAVKFILSKVIDISVRDIDSLNLLKQININAKLTSDPVWMEYNPNYKRQRFKDNILAINLRSWPSIDNNFIKIFSNKIADLAINNNLKIEIIPLQKSIDYIVCKNLYDDLKNNYANIKVTLLEENLTHSNLEIKLKNYKYMIAMRYHALLISLINGISVFGLSYDPKITSLMSSISAPYIDMNNFSQENLSINLDLWQTQFTKDLNLDDVFLDNKIMAYNTVKDIIRVIKG